MARDGEGTRIHRPGGDVIRAAPTDEPLSQQEPEDRGMRRIIFVNRYFSPDRRQQVISCPTALFT